MNRWKQFSILFLSQGLSYFLIVANTRAFTHDRYGATLITDGLIAMQSFIVGKFMVETKELRSWVAGLGMTLGGMAGSVLSIWVTKRFY